MENGLDPLDDREKVIMVIKIFIKKILNIIPSPSYRVVIWLSLLGNI